MRLRSIVTFAAMILPAACSSPSGLSATRDTAVMVDDLNHPSWPTDRIVVDSATVIDDERLRLYTSFGGGCQHHAFALLVDRAFMESNPPRLRTRVAHDARGDMCKAIVLQTLEVALQPVREHFHQSYGTGPGSVVLLIDGREVIFAFQ
jgi:hypothetical protein